MENTQSLISKNSASHEPLDITVVIETREHLLGTLAEAAEIEHNLMCLYLYAMFSLKRTTAEGVSEKELKAIEKWRRVILGVALEEMNHLTLVSNLIAAIGGSPNFNRPNFPATPGAYPSDIVIELAPFDLSTIEHFIYLERPASREVPDGASFPHSMSYTRTVPRKRLMPSSGDYATVGTLYRAVREAIAHLCKNTGEKEFFCGSTDQQIGPLDSPLPGLVVVKDQATAFQALDTIVNQGEGATNEAGSHFERFQGIRDEYVELLKENPEFTPGRSVARNPVMRQPAEPKGKIWITEPLAARYMDLANALYTFMLRILVQIYAQENRPARAKKVLLETSYTLMHAMASVAETLTLLPAKSENSPCFSGMSFAMLRSMAPLELKSEKALIIERLKEIEWGFETLQSEVETKRTGDQHVGTCIDELLKSRGLIEKMRATIEATDWMSKAETNATPPTQPTHIEAPKSPMPKISDQGPLKAPEKPLVEIANGKNISVEFEARRCIHARHCVTELPEVFKANTPGEWLFPDKTEAEVLASVIRECPSGALHYKRHDGKSDEPAPDVNMIRLRENGPYAVRADIKLNGKASGFRATLCRCGASRNKPFCDGTHVESKFEATGEPASQKVDALTKRDGELKITPLKNGPLYVEGNLELCAGTGRVVVRTEDVHLCRCGHSQTKPICDSSHIIFGFTDEVTH